MARSLCENRNGFDPRERSVEEEFQAAQWGALLARDRAVGRYPGVWDTVVGPTKMEGLDELCARFSNGVPTGRELRSTRSRVRSVNTPVAQAVFTAQREA